MQETNIVILNKYYDKNMDLQHHLFKEDEFINYFLENEYDMYDILVLIKAFISKSEARKNWTRTGKEIPPGYNEYKNIGKQKKALYIWNPIQYINNSCNVQQDCLAHGDCDPECDGY